MLYQYTTPYITPYYRYQRPRGALVAPGNISRGRSIIRIKTGMGVNKSPGARLVEKFMIREKTRDAKLAGGFTWREARDINNQARTSPVISGDRTRRDTKFGSSTEVELRLPVSREVEDPDRQVDRDKSDSILTYSAKKDIENQEGGKSLLPKDIIETEVEAAGDEDFIKYDKVVSDLVAKKLKQALVAKPSVNKPAVSTTESSTFIFVNKLNYQQTELSKLTQPIINKLTDKVNTTTESYSTETNFEYNRFTEPKEKTISKVQSPRTHRINNENLEQFTESKPKEEATPSIQPNIQRIANPESVGSSVIPAEVLYEFKVENKNSEEKGSRCSKTDSVTFTNKDNKHKLASYETVTENCKEETVFKRGNTEGLHSESDKNCDISAASNLESDTELEEVETDEDIMEAKEVKKKKKVIVKKKGSKVKVTPLEAKPPKGGATAGVSSPGEILRQLSKKRMSLADEDLCCLVERKTSITDAILVQEAAYLDSMIREEMKDRRKASLGFIPEEVISKCKKDSSANKGEARRASPPAPVKQEDRRAAWKQTAFKRSVKTLGKFYKPQVRDESSDEECDVNCHRKCQWLMPNLCGVNQKLMAEALSRLNIKTSKTSSSSGSSRRMLDYSLLKLNSSESSSSSSDIAVGRVSPPAKTLPRFRKYSIADFQFLKVLGKGSFGKVLLAELKGSECYYAVKCLKKDVVLEDDDVECTMIERKVLALATGHPYFSHLFCTFQTPSHLFFVMEYLNGGDLMFHIQQNGRFDEGRARFYAAEIVSGLSYLHKWGIVYRDLKLDNVLLDFDGHVRIADFGMCKLQIYLDKTTDTFCGTPDYMAPEIIKGLKYNQCVDWWSFGVLLYELLVGQSPFSGCDEDDLFWSVCNSRPHMPSYLSQPAKSILFRLMDKDWTKRLGSGENGSAEVKDHAFFDGLKWHLLEEKRLDPPFKPSMRHPLDTKYFDKVFTSEKPTLTPVDRTILESMDQSQFQGFSYTNPNATE